MQKKYQIAHNNNIIIEIDDFCNYLNEKILPNITNEVELLKYGLKLKDKLKYEYNTLT
jgi:hypothetical protein